MQGGYKTTLCLIIGFPEHSTKEGRQNMTEQQKKAAKVSRQYMIDRARSRRTWTYRRG